MRSHTTPLFESGTFDGGAAHLPNGCHVVEVEIDQGTGTGGPSADALAYIGAVEARSGLRFGLTLSGPLLQRP